MQNIIRDIKWFINSKLISRTEVSKWKNCRHRWGGGDIHKKRLGGVGDLGGYIPNSDSKGRKVGGDLPGVMT